MCDQRLLLAKYNEAAELHNRRSPGQLAMWSTSLVEAVKQAAESHRPQNESTELRDTPAPHISNRCIY